MAKPKTSKETRTNYAVRPRRVNDTRSAKTHTLVEPKAEQKQILGKYIVIDPKIRRGKPTFLGTRIPAAAVLAQVAKQVPWEKIIAEFDRQVSREAIVEAVKLASKALTEEARTILQSRDARDLEIINRNAERLNQEALDVLEYQVIP